jgi:hypothetical protein
MKKETCEKVKKEFKSCVNNTILRLKKSKGNYRPFHSKLLSEEILKASMFERSFSTSFGQRVIEVISRVIAADVSGTESVENQKKTFIKISQETIASIHDHLEKLRDNTLGRKAKWDDDLKMISISTNKLEEQRIISDLWFKRNNVDYFFSIKTVKPNIDQTMEAKKDVLRLKTSIQSCRPYFALPYNPYGENKYDYGHTPPFKIFDMINDEVVLIGKEYWDVVGGEGTYDTLLELVEEVGKETRKTLSKLDI